MIRSLILTLTIVVLASTPPQARGGGHGSHGGGHGSHGGHGHSGHHHHSHPFGGFLFGVLPGGPFFTQFPYGYPCWWDEGHWVGQVYEDKYGNSTYVPEWVPGRWQCPEAEVDDAWLI